MKGLDEYPDHSGLPLPPGLRPEGYVSRTASETLMRRHRMAERAYAMRRAHEEEARVRKERETVREARRAERAHEEEVRGDLRMLAGYPWKVPETVPDTDGPCHTLTARYDLDTGRMVREGVINDRQVMFTMRLDGCNRGRMRVYGKGPKGHTIDAVFEISPMEGFGDLMSDLGMFIEDNSEELGI